MNLQRSTTWLAVRTHRGRPRTKARAPTLIERMAELAEPQGGVVARWQLIAAEIAPGTVDGLVARGVLRVVHAGVYALGQRRLALPARLWAGLLAVGPSSRLAGVSLAALLGLRGLRDSESVEVVMPVDLTRRRRGVVAHRVRLHATECHEHVGMPACSVARMLLDIAAWHGNELLEEVWRQARYRELLDMEAVAAVIDRHPGERGVLALRKLHDRRDAILGRSESRGEVRTRHAALAAGFAEPKLNEPVVMPSGRRSRYDLFWPELGLVVEYDGPYHDDPEVTADDALRDAESRLLGHRVERVHWTEQWQHVEARLRDLRAELAIDLR